MNQEDLQPYLISMRSILSGKIHQRELMLTPAQYEEIQPWVRGGRGPRLIQHVVPHLSPEDREFLISGITPEEWEAEFGSEEE